MSLIGPSVSCLQGPVRGSYSGVSDVQSSSLDTS